MLNHHRQHSIQVNNGNGANYVYCSFKPGTVHLFAFDLLISLLRSAANDGIDATLGFNDGIEKPEGLIIYPRHHLVWKFHGHHA